MAIYPPIDDVYPNIWEQVKKKLETEGAKNKVYDSDLDGIVDNADTVDGEHASAFEHVVNKGVANGYCPLDANALVPLANIPTIPRTKLEYPTEDVSFAYLAAINKINLVEAAVGGIQCVTVDNFTDKAVQTVSSTVSSICIGRFVDSNNYYFNRIDINRATSDHLISIVNTGSWTDLGSESIDLSATKTYIFLFSIVGSTLKSFRTDITTPKITVTDTTFSSGSYGIGHNYYTNGGGFASLAGKLLAPATQLPPPLKIIEVDIVGSGSENDPIRPNFKQLLDKHPKFGVIDKNAVTWGAFDHKEQHNTMLITITAGNPYTNNQAILQQIEHAKSKNLIVISPPHDYNEAVEQYKHLRKNFPEWIAGKDNYAYQTLGLKEFEWFQVADTYYGNIVDGLKPEAYKDVPDWEMRKTLAMWKERLKRAKILKLEAEKHLKKLEEVEKKGW